MEANEIIRKFSTQYFRNCYPTNRDTDEYHDMMVCGVEEAGQFRGYVWIKRSIDFSAVYCSLVQYVFGIVEDANKWDDIMEQEVPCVKAGVEYLHRQDAADKIWILGEIPPELLIERDGEDRVIFCGLQQEGLRHGLGVDFIYEGKKVRQSPGIWEAGTKIYHYEEGVFQAVN